jgi:hypothetical protein
MQTVGYRLPMMPFPVFEELDYLACVTTSFTEEPIVEDFLEIKIVKSDQIDGMIEAGLEEIWSNYFVQEVLKQRIIDLNDLSVEQCEATLMMVCPVIKCKSEGRYIIGTKLKAIIKQGNNLILK